MALKPSFFAVERPADLPGCFQEWLNTSVRDPLSPVWVVVSSAPMRQRLDWDLSRIGENDGAISSNFRYFFPEEFVATVEELTLASLGKVRHEWTPETIAARLVALAPDALTWREAVAEASVLDEMVRWRRDEFDPSKLSKNCETLLRSDEWAEHGPFVQRDHVVNALRAGVTSIAPTIALYGLDNAPGGVDFVNLLLALAQNAEVAAFSLYPSAARVTAPKQNGGVTWWRSLDEHLAVWRSAGITPVARSGTERPNDLGGLQRALGGVVPPEPLTNDGSVRVLGTVGPARQVELVRDEIVALLEGVNGEAVSPERILVTSPNLAHFTSHIHRHFGYSHYERDGQGDAVYRLPRVAFEVTERDRSGYRNRARLLGCLLDLVGNYVTVDQVDELLQFTPLLDAIGVTTADGMRLMALAQQARTVFGITGEQRADTGVYEATSEVGTWRRLFDRLALTAMMPDVDDDDQLGTGDDIARVGAFYQVLRAISTAQEDLEDGQHRTLTDWTAWCQVAFGRWLTRGQSRDDSLERMFARVRQDFAWADEDVQLPFTVFRDYLQSLLSGGTSSLTIGRYGVHVAPLPALSNGSYDYVFIVGLDEENLPSPSIASPVLRPARTGDPNPRAAVLGELLLCVNAGEKGVTFTYNCRNEVSGEKVATSVAMDELNDFLTGAPVFVEGSRHGFVRPQDRPVVKTTFDPRYSDLGSTIVQSGSLPDPLVARTTSMSEAAQHFRVPTRVTLKELRRFLQSSAEHFVTRGLLGQSLERIGDPPQVPRISYDGLDNYNLCLEAIEYFAGLRGERSDSSPDAVVAAILARESVAADVAPALIRGVAPESLAVAGEKLRSDLDSLEAVSATEAAEFYREIQLPSGMTVAPRTGLPDERNPFTVWADHSSRHGGYPGCPSTWRLHPNEVTGVKERRDSLAMIVDLLVMRANQPNTIPGLPVTSLFSFTTTAKGGLPQRAYRYLGSRDEAIQRLDELMALYVRGLKEPLAIGRYTTPNEFEGGSIFDAYAEDLNSSQTRIVFGSDVREFLRLAQLQGVTAWFEKVYQRLEVVRETATQRKVGRHSADSVALSEWKLPSEGKD